MYTITGHAYERSRRSLSVLMVSWNTFRSCSLTNSSLSSPASRFNAIPTITALRLSPRGLLPPTVQTNVATCAAYKEYSVSRCSDGATPSSGLRLIAGGGIGRGISELPGGGGGGGSNGVASGMVASIWTLLVRERRAAVYIADLTRLPTFPSCVIRTNTLSANC